MYTYILLYTHVHVYLTIYTCTHIHVSYYIHMYTYILPVSGTSVGRAMERICSKSCRSGDKPKKNN